MEIHGLVVCVNYADYLARSLDRWLSGLTSLVVVTDLRDLDTATLIGEQLAEMPGPKLTLHRTDAFYADGAKFNKGRAMQEARALLPSPLPALPSPWHLFFDADVIPPPNWQAVIAANAPQAGTLYGARRIEEDGRAIPDGEIAGYFQLFAAADPRAAQPLDAHWYHAGNYDSRFAWRWDSKTFLPLTLTHLGERGANWCGRGNAEAMSTLRAERLARRGWSHEVVGAGK